MKRRIEHRRRACASLFGGLFAVTLALAGPPGGGAPGGAPGGGAGSQGGGGAGGGAPGSASGGAPTTPNGFFSQTSTNYARPKSGEWGNWFKTLEAPWNDSVDNTLLCYRVDPTGDASIPYLFTRVSQLRTSAGQKSPLPCDSRVKGANQRPLVHGDRLRVAIDLGDVDVDGFFKNVSVINLNVTLTVAPPLQPTLLRPNVGAPVTTSGLGGTAAGEALSDPDNARRCAQSFLGLARNANGLANAEGLADPGASCEGLGKKISAVAAAYESQQATPNLAALTARDSVIILSWRYALPGDVIPTISINALYTTPLNGEPWQPRQYYPTGMLVACPGEDLCAVDRPGQSSVAEPTWPGPMNQHGGVGDGTLADTLAASCSRLLPFFYVDIVLSLTLTRDNRMGNASGTERCQRIFCRIG